MPHMRVFVLLVACLCLSHTCSASPGDYVPTLPGLATPPAFKNYAGYSTVSESHGRALFWFLSEASDVDPATAPLILWLTGGPGCSSLSAWMTENGPWRPTANGSLVEFPYAWNKIANMVWLESPAGVGFSYSNTSSDYKVGDERTANDSYAVLQDLLGNRFPQWAGNDFWITGESYGGHYVPELAYRILQGGGPVKINLKGFMVGNAWTVPAIDNAGAVNTWWQRALVPKQWSTDILNNCNLSDYGPLKDSAGRLFAQPQCDDATNKAMAAFQDAGVNIYDIYVDDCGGSTEKGYLEALAKAGSPAHRVMHASQQVNTVSGWQPIVNPCLGEWVSPYLNRVDVQQAMHVRNPGSKHWNECGGVDYEYSSVMSSVLPIYEKLLNESDINILVYSGDVDAIVPYDGSRTWIESLGRPVQQEWRAWHNKDRFGNQVGGFVVKFDRMTFATVRQAGHQVPTYRPSRAYTMFSEFLMNQQLPK